jgi:chromosome segregation ATPase
MNSALKHGAKDEAAAGDLLDARALVDFLAARIEGPERETGQDERKRLTEALEGLTRRMRAPADAQEAGAASHFEEQTRELAQKLERSTAGLSAEVAELRQGLARLAQAAHDSLEDMDARLAAAPSAPTAAVAGLERQVQTLRTLLDKAQRDLDARLEAQAAAPASLDAVSALARRAAEMAERQEAALAHLGARLEQLAPAPSDAGAQDGRAAAAALQAVHDRLDGLQAEQARQRTAEEYQSARLSELAARFEERPGAVLEQLQALTARMAAAEQAAGPELRTWVEEATDRARRAAEAASNAALERHAVLARETQQQLEAAARRSDAAVEAFAAQQQALSAQLAQLTQRQIATESAAGAVRDALEQRAAALSAQAEAALESARRELDARVAAAIAAVQSNSLGEGVNAALQRIGALEGGQRALAQEVSVELRRWSEALDRRLRGHESRLTTESDALKRLLERFERLENHAVEAAGDTRDALSRLSARIEDRASAAERKAAQSLEQVGGQIVELAERMDARQRAMLRETSERLEAVEREAAASAAGYASQLLDRITGLEARVAELARAAPQPAAADAPAQAFQLSWSVKGGVRPLSDAAGEEEAQDIDEFAESPSQPTYALVDVLDAMMAANPSYPQRTRGEPQVHAEQAEDVVVVEQPEVESHAAESQEADQFKRPFVDGFDPALAARPALDAVDFNDLFEPGEAAAQAPADAPRGKNASREPGAGVVLRTLLWATAVIAVGSSIYAFSRGSRPVTGDADLDARLPPAEQRKATARAANRVLEAAAGRIEMSRRFSPAAVELPSGEAAEAPTALEAAAAASGPAIPLQMELEH